MTEHFKSVTVFCGASKEIDPALFPQAYRMGEIIGEKKKKPAKKRKK